MTEERKLRPFDEAFRNEFKDPEFVLEYLKAAVADGVFDEALAESFYARQPTSMVVPDGEGENTMKQRKIVQVTAIPPDSTDSRAWLVAVSDDGRAWWLNMQDGIWISFPRLPVKDEEDSLTQRMAALLVDMKYCCDSRALQMEAESLIREAGYDKYTRVVEDDEEPRISLEPTRRVFPTTVTRKEESDE